MWSYLQMELMLPGRTLSITSRVSLSSMKRTRDSFSQVEVSPGTARRLLTQLVSQRLVEWSVLTDDDVSPVAFDLASEVLGPGLEFARSVQKLDGLIRFLMVRPTWSVRKLPTALALARDNVQVDAEIARTALFSKNTVLSDYTNNIAGFAMGLYEELGRGLRNDAEYVRTYRDKVCTSAKARRDARLL